MTQPTCYQKSCWCCLCRVIERLCSKEKNNPVQAATVRVAEVKLSPALGPIPTHTRTRTWQLVQGQPRYLIDDTKV